MYITLEELAERSGVKDHTLTSAEREELMAAIQQYNAVATDFAPHERPESSRRREVEAVRDKYNIGPEKVSAIG